MFNTMSNDTAVRYLLWIYLLLLIFEGALRKWVLPGLATPLLVVRDPVAILAIALGLRHLIGNLYAVLFMCMGVLCILLAMMVGHGNHWVAIFGGRILILHLPLIFLFPAVFSSEDFWIFAKFTLVLSIPMVILMGFQYYLPQSHFVNVGVGGEGSSGFSAALGRYRSSGTFAFTNGVSMFFAVAASMMACWITNAEGSNPKWFWITVGCLLLAVPLSISRALAFSYLLIGLAMVVSGALSPRHIKRLILSTAIAFIIMAPITQLPIFKDSTEAFMARWERATEGEGDGKGVQGVLEGRVLDSFTEPWERLDRIPLFGYGIGIGTQTGTFLYFGRRGFILGEGEWYRVTGELGIIMSIAYIGLRIWLALLLLLKSLALSRSGNSIPLVMCPIAMYWLIIGSTGQATSLGFIVVLTGLWALSFKTQEEKLTDFPDEEDLAVEI